MTSPSNPDLQPLQRPTSISRFWFNLLAGCVGLGFLAWRQSVEPSAHLDNGLHTALLVAALIGLYEHFRLRSHRNPSAGLEWDAPSPSEFGRTLVKLLGLGLTLSIIACAYALFPEYQDEFYQPYWQVLKAYGLGILSIAPLYFWWLDGRLKQPHDAYWHLGLLPMQLLQGKGPDAAARRMLAIHFGGWAIKAFFVPLMVVYVGREVKGVQMAWDSLGTDAYAPFEVLFHLTYMIDLLFSIIGYTLTVRLFDSHIRWTEPTFFGWVIALMCYQPFFSLVDNLYLRYEDGYTWGTWLADLPALKFVWATALVGLLATYGLSTVAFGLRFSNLTARGIVTDGPYRFSKHPAYIAKNLSWWMIAIPFIAATPAAAVTNCAHLLLINAIYFARARTEEAHLSQDPVYVQYALWINQHGLLARLGRAIPFLRYRAPEATRH